MREGDQHKSTTVIEMKRIIDLKIDPCQMCAGFGHPYYLCPTKKRLDTWARSNQDVNDWADFKYKNYWSKLTTNGQDIARRQARNAAMPPRKKRRFWKK